MIGITFRQLEVFVCAVEAGSFRACADRLSISQMAVSEHIRALERHLRRPLLDRRRGTAATPTEAGREAYLKARQILGETRELLSAPGPAAETRSRLRIAAHGYIAESMSRLLARFASDRPDVSVELERRTYEGVLGGLLDGEIDLGLFLSFGPVAEIDSMLAWREPLGLYVGRAHSLAGRPALEAADLQGQPFIQLPLRSHLRLQVNAALAGLGVRDWPVAITSDDLAMIVENLLGGSSFACLFARGGDELVAEGRLERLDLSTAIPPLEVRYAVPASRRGDPVVAELIGRLPPAYSAATLAAAPPSSRP